MNNTMQEINEFSPDHKVSHYNNAAFNIRKKIIIESQRTECEDIDKVFPIAVDQHVNRIDSWRSYNSDLDDNKHQGIGRMTSKCLCCLKERNR